MLPPPAPVVTMSIIGTRTGNPSIRESVVIDGFEITIPRNASYDAWKTGSGVALINTQYCEVRNCHIYRTLREGIMIYTSGGDTSTNSSYNTIANNRIEYAGGLAGGQDDARMSWLYEEFAKHTAAELAVPVAAK